MLQRTRAEIQISIRSGSSLHFWSGAALSRYLGKNEGKERTSRVRTRQHDERLDSERAEEMKRRRAQLQELLQRAFAERQSKLRPQ